MFAHNPEWAMRVIKRHKLKRDAHFTHFINEPLYLANVWKYRFPGTFVVRTEAGSVIILMAEQQVSRQVSKRETAIALDFDATLCEEVGECRADCTCEDENYDDDCRYCDGGCECDSCMAEPYMCITHGESHQQTQTLLSLL